MGRILVVGPAWVGDMVMAQSLFMSLKQIQPGTEIEVLAPAWSLPLLKRMPEVSKAICLPVGHGELGLMKRWKVGRMLHQQGYSQAMIIPRSYKAALVPFFAGIPRRTGYRGEMRFGLINDMRPLDKSVLRQTVQRLVALGRDTETELPPDIPYPRLQLDQSNQDRLLEQWGLNLDKPIIGLMPGAEYGPAKQWPIKHYADLARKLTERGYQVWLFGSEKEKSLADEITERSPKATTNLCGKTRLEDAIDLIACCEKVVTNDSGLMHIACATGVEVIAIYGSSDPDYTPPLSDRAEVIYQGLDCSPCFKRTCPLGHTRCLNDIVAEDVMKLI